eukprot:TRINITY_DN11894_c0_g1_i1.p4 TRINITY_DN11894_c0_g1~~TRINITY_DN11894_c0_g1_i1.p4  ORF type:complete len:100 (+),score=40.31 TRINITY_DN11894_c0_g1_i1:48-302(+)
MSAMRTMAQVARPLGRRTVMTTASGPYATIKDKLFRSQAFTGKSWRHSAFLDSRNKMLNDVWFENAIFYYSLMLTPFAALLYLQ